MVAEDELQLPEMQARGENDVLGREMPLLRRPEPPKEEGLGHHAYGAIPDCWKLASTIETENKPIQKKILERVKEIFS